MRVRTVVVALATLLVLVVAGYVVTVVLFESGERIEQPRTVTVEKPSTQG